MRQIKLVLALGLAGLLTLLTIQSGLATTAVIQTPSYLPIIFKHPTLTPTATATPTATCTATATATTTRTPTRTELPPTIEIAFIDFWPGGNEAQNEYVRIENHGQGPTTLTNWTLCDSQSNCYLFPVFTLAAGAKVKVWTGPGVNDALNLHWGRTDPVWDNGGDMATLRNASAVLIDTYVYAAPLRQPAAKHSVRKP